MIQTERLQMFRLFLILVLFNVCIFVNAGLDEHGRFGEVIAVYYFDDSNDDGPNNFHGNLRNGASIVQGGKIGKCLKLRKDTYFAMLDDTFSSIVRNFSIVAWIKTSNISAQGDISISYSGENDDDSISEISLDITSDEIYGIIADGEDDEVDGLIARRLSIDDGKFHHIAFTLAEDFYRIFVDGEIVEEEKRQGYTGWVSNDTFILIDANRELTNPVYVDEVGFFKTGFSVYEVRALMNVGLAKFLDAMPVDPQEKVATTWAEIKSGR